MELLILGVTAKDKGSQLEALVHSELASQGYTDVYSNVISAGGNELDVVGMRQFELMGSLHTIPLLCEAKAYADPVNVPTWQRFLGKLFLERVEKPTTVGMLVALNGVNGNVRGSVTGLHKKDNSVFVFDGNQLLGKAKASGEIADQATIISTVHAEFRRNINHVDSAYYGGGYFWVVWWNDDEYSVVNGHGLRMAAEKVEKLRDALAGSISGSLLAADEAQAQAEERHNIKASIINRLIKGEAITISDETPEEEQDVLAGLAAEPFCQQKDGELTLVTAPNLEAAGVSKLFTSLFENAVAVRHLDFMVGFSHEPYIQRLIDTLPEHQSGFTLSDNELEQLRKLSPYFPSVWITLAQPIPMITVHRAAGGVSADEAIHRADRNAFWDRIIEVARDDFTNVFLRGLLYDHVGLAEIEEATHVSVKSKDGIVGSIETRTRTAIRQLSDDFVSEVGTKHALIRLLSTASEPWEESHPEPTPV